MSPANSYACCFCLNLSNAFFQYMNFIFCFFSHFKIIQWFIAFMYCCTVWPMRRNYLQISKKKQQYWVTDLNIVWRACAVPEIKMILEVSCGPRGFCHWIISSPLSRVKNSMKQNNCSSVVEKETPLIVTFSVKIGRKMVYF